MRRMFWQHSKWFSVAIVTTVIAQVPIVNVSPSTVVSLKDRPLTLGCTVTGVLNPIVYWKDPKGIIYELDPTQWIGFGSGHRRFSYDFNGNSYNLKISLVEPEDTGDFLCIAKPRNGTGRPISDAVKLTVYVRPANITVVGTPPVVVDRNVTTVPYNQAQANITCSVGPSKPAVPIKWFKNGGPITFGVVNLPTVLQGDSLEITASVLVLNQPSRELNNMQYMCLADLAALNIAGVDLQPMNRTFNLSVQYPPGEPVIKGFTAGAPLEPGDILILECSASGGNPFPTLQWFRNGKPYFMEFRTDEKSYTVTSELRLNITAADNSAQYRCDAKNAAIETAYSTSVTLNVKFRPSFVVITGQENAVAGSPLVLTCTTANSNPQAIISWFSRGISLRVQDGDTKVTSSPDGGLITQTNITLPLTREDEGREVTCQANNAETRGTAIQTIYLSVTYPPSQLQITGSDTSVAVKEGDVLKLTCLSTDGNPLPDIKWLNGTTEMSAGPVEERGRTRSRELLIIAKASDNNANLTCTASNKATIVPLARSKTISVLFAPQDIRIDYSPKPARAGQEVAFKCFSGSSNPVSFITWVKNDSAVSNSSYRELGRTRSLYGGWETSSEYKLVPSASDNGLMLHCNARNDAIFQSRSGGLTLDIQHKPYFTSVPATVFIREGENKTVSFPVTANPPVTAYEVEKTTGGTETVGADGILSLVNVKRDKSGTYRVKATNGEGSSTADFLIDVQYGAEIKGDIIATYIDTTSTVKISCTVDTNPAITVFKWTRANYDMARITTSVTGSVPIQILSMEIANVVKTDLGIFTCEAANPISGTTKAFELKASAVKFPPIIDKSPSTSKAAAPTYTDAVIFCAVDAVPQPTIIWKKADSILTIDQVKYTQSTEATGDMSFKFVLTVKKVTEQDYGVYKCSVTNPKGSDEHSITLDGTSKPDPPYDLAVTDVTDKSVSLSWKPGFNGGLEQSFRVRYQPSTGGKNFYYADAFAVPFVLSGLEPETEYSITVQGINAKGDSPYQTAAVTAKTAVSTTVKEPLTSKKQEQPVIIIIALVLSVLGGLLLIVTTVLVVIFVRRRRRKKLSEATDSASQSNTVEMYGTHEGSFFNDDAKSYSTYEKGLDEDFAKHYEEDNDQNFIKATYGQGQGHATYLTEDPLPVLHPPVLSQPWSKLEDPRGTFGSYVKRSVPSHNEEEVYANELRSFSKALHPEEYKRPAFVAGRPPPPPPPDRSSSKPSLVEPSPSIPERNYSPLVNYSKGPGLYHASLGRSTPSVESTDDMRGHLV